MECRLQWRGSWGYSAIALTRKFLSYYVRARHYAAILGNWTSVDPLWPSEMPYGYVENRVMTGVDYWGMQAHGTKASARSYWAWLKDILNDQVSGKPGTTPGLFDDWSRTQPRDYNCYEYACNVVGFGTPGYSSRKMGEIIDPKAHTMRLVTDCSFLISMVKRDIRFFRPKGNPVYDKPKGGKCKAGYFEVRVYNCPPPCNEGRGDFHFVKQNPDGTWSDKHGRSNFGSINSNDCTHIINPDLHTKNVYKRMGGESQLCGALCVKELL